MTGEFGKLTIKRQQDIKELCFHWELLVRTVEYPTKTFAVTVIYTLTTLYLRGQDIRLDGPTVSREKRLDHAMCLGAAMELLVEHRGSVWYPTLRNLGFDSVENISKLLSEYTEHLRENRGV